MHSIKFLFTYISIIFKTYFQINTDICILFEIFAIDSRYLNIFADISNLI